MAVLEDVLADADGFAGTSDQERYDECEMVITRVLRDVRSIAHAWKVRTLLTTLSFAQPFA